MMRTFLVGAALCLAAAPAFAGQDDGRVTVGFNAGYQAATNNFSDRLTFQVYQEAATTNTTYPVKGDFLLDGGASVRFWKGLAAGVSVSHYTRNATAHTASRVPHPFFLEQLRDVTGDVSGVTRTETGAHVQIIYLIPTSGKLRFAVSAGPSYINVKQELVAAVRYQDTYPYDTATFTDADVRTVKGSKAGFNAGADIAWMFSRQVGVGGIIRFARATVDLKTPDNRTMSVDAGGAQAGVGLRVRF